MMKYVEHEKYKVTCVLEQSEMFCYGVSLDDILSRTPAGWNCLRILKEKAMSVTDYEWPGCAYSSQIEARSNGDVAITFSETIEDFVYNLRQSLMIADSADKGLAEFINTIESSDEETARSLIRRFEANVRNQMTSDNKRDR